MCVSIFITTEPVNYDNLIGDTPSPVKLSHTQATPSSDIPIDIDKEDENTTDAVAMAAIAMNEINDSSLTESDNSQTNKRKRVDEKSDRKKTKKVVAKKKSPANTRKKGRPVSKRRS